MVEADAGAEPGADAQGEAGVEQDASAQGDAGTEQGAGTEADAIDGGYDRKQAALYVLPFLLLGLADVILLLGWGLDPLWGFMILPPILFMSVLAWLGFRTGFVGKHRGSTE
ncbi:MAG: hypothetical protein ABEJ40_09185 [Haloarculaceae archaeon]